MRYLLIYCFGRDYSQKVLPDEFDERVPFNSKDGKDHIALFKNNSWRLIEITNNNTIEGSCRRINGLTYE